MAPATVPDRVDGYAEPNNNGCVEEPGGPLDLPQSAKYWFNGSGWTAGRKDRVDIAADRWETTRDHDGQRLVDLDRGSAGSEYEIVIEAPASGAAGNMSCGQKKMRLNPFVFMRSHGYQIRLTAHEFGHMVGHEHAASDASSLGAQYGLMATCLSESQREQADFNTDDEAGHLSFHSLSEVHGDEPMHANFGFERNARWWSRSHTSANWNINTTNPSTGQKALGFRTRYKKADYIWQDISMTPEGDLDIWARAQGRLRALTDQGSVATRLWVKEHRYNSGGSCSYHISKNLDSPDTVYNATRVYTEIGSTTRPMAGGYKNMDVLHPSHTGSHSEAPHYDVPEAWDAVDTRVIVESHVKDVVQPSTGGWILLDNVRGYQHE